MSGRAVVITVSDRVAAGTADDESGPALVERLETLGFRVEASVVPDERARISAAVESAIGSDAALVVTTGGTGVAPRDVTPQTLTALLDYEVPGFGEVMRAEGRRSTELADLSRSLAGVRARTLVLCVPGSPRGALESLEAIVPLLGHALGNLRADEKGHPIDGSLEAAHTHRSDG
jgi:molybdopterin adenylyltransferase